MTKHAAFIENAKNAPGTYYRIPNDVLRDRRLSPSERIEVLKAWRQQVPIEVIGNPISVALAEAEIQFVGGEA